MTSQVQIFELGHFSNRLRSPSRYFYLQQEAWVATTFTNVLSFKNLYSLNEKLRYYSCIKSPLHGFTITRLPYSSWRGLHLLVSFQLFQKSLRQKVEPFKAFQTKVLWKRSECFWHLELLGPMSVAVLQKAVGISGPLSCFEAFSSSSCANVRMKEKETTLIERTWKRDFWVQK